jgi:hypothetical protein
MHFLPIMTWEATDVVGVNLLAETDAGDVCGIEGAAFRPACEDTFGIGGDIGDLFLLTWEGERVFIGLLLSRFAGGEEEQADGGGGEPE